jgi:hypothetical protein
VKGEVDAESRSRGRSGRLLAKAAYWAAVLIVSLALLVGLILLLESRDDSSVSGGLIQALPL